MTAKCLLVALGFVGVITSPHAAESTTAAPQLSITKVERTQRWEMAGPFPGARGFVEAKQSEEILVVHLDVESHGPITLNGFELIDETGKKNEQCKTNIMGWDGDVPPGGIAIPFTIPKGLRVKKLSVRDPATEVNIPEK